MAIIEEIIEGEEDQLAKVESIKKLGNEHFGKGEYEKAEEKYKEAIEACPEPSKAVRAVVLSNLAAALIKQEKWKEAGDAATESIEIGDTNEKALERRAFAHSNISEKYEAAIEDYKQLQTICEKRKAEFERKIGELSKKIDERNEALKADVIEKLKGFGDFCLKPFGLSTNSFELKPNEQGGFSVQMKNSQQQSEQE